VGSNHPSHPRSRTRRTPSSLFLSRLQEIALSTPLPLLDDEHQLRTKLQRDGTQHHARSVRIRNRRRSFVSLRLFLVGTLTHLRLLLFSSHTHRPPPHPLPLFPFHLLLCNSSSNQSHPKLARVHHEHAWTEGSTFRCDLREWTGRGDQENAVLGCWTGGKREVEDAGDVGDDWRGTGCERAGG